MKNAYLTPFFARIRKKYLNKVRHLTVLEDTGLVEEYNCRKLTSPRRGDKIRVRSIQMRKTVVRVILRTSLLLALLGILAVSTFAEGGGPTPWDPPPSLSTVAN